jgi:hypothetical protein
VAEYIPVAFYHVIYHYVIFFCVLLTVIQAMVHNGVDFVSLSFNKVGVVALLLFLVFYIGFRPVSGVFVDMTVYNLKYARFQDGGSIDVGKDIGFYTFMKWCSGLMSSSFFFFLCALVYVVPPYLAFRKWFPHYAFIALLFYAGSFLFFAYGTNGIRSGMASSLFLLAVAYADKRWLATSLLLISFYFHASMLLPIAAFLLAYVYRNVRVYFLIWLLCILMSLSLGGFWEGLLGGVESSDERLQEYMSGEGAVSGTFRWDFILYSAFAVFSGLYYTRVKLFDDPLYVRLLNTYLTANAFWVLVIRANYSNRFAYLSWFLLPIIIFYPLLKKTMMEQQYLKTSLILFIYFMFTYVMNVLLS